MPYQEMEEELVMNQWLKILKVVWIVRELQKEIL